MNVCDIDSEMKVRCAVLQEKGSGTADVRGWLSPRIVVHTRRLLSFSNNVSFTSEEIETFIEELCTT